MSVKIVSGATADELTVDATSKAARMTQYTSAGALLNPEYAGSYVARIEIIPTTLTAGTTYWAMRNTGTKRVFIRRVEMVFGFSGTAAASRSLYEIERFSSATPTGGTAITVVLKDNTFPATSVGDIRFAPAGLVTTGVSFAAVFHLMGHSNQLASNFAQDLHYLPEEASKFVLAVNEGLAIRANTAVVLGTYLVGSISWDERT